MRWQTTAILAVVLLALGAFYYVYEIRGGPERAKVEAQKGRLWTVDAADVTEVELRRGGEVVTLKREPDGWRLVGPVTARGDRGKVDETLTTLTTARVDREIESAPTRLEAYGLDKPGSTRIKEFVAESPKSLAPYGLVRPLRVSIHTGRDKDRATASLLIGSVDKAKQGAYAMRPGESSVLLLPAEAWAIVPKNVAVLRNKVVVEVDRDKVARVDLESPKGKVALTQEQNRWRIVAPENLPADQVESGALLFKLRDLKAQAFLTEDASGIPRYLARPTVRVTVTETGAAAPTTVLLAPAPDRRGGKAMAYAAVAGRGPVVIVGADALDGLARSVTELRDRTVLPALEPRDVKTVRVRAGGQTVVVERSGEADWRMVEGGTGAAKGANVENLLYTLRGLKWNAIAAPGGQDPVRYGLDAPTFEVTLLRAGGAEIATVLVGRHEGDHAYVKLKVLPAIYAVDTKALGELPKIPDDFKG